MSPTEISPPEVTSMNTLALLAELTRRRVALWSEGPKLRYRAPSGSLDPELRQALARHKAALLPMVAAAGLDDEAFPEGEAPRSALVGPMSPSQRTQWFLHRTTPHSPAPHVAFALRLRGDLHVDALRRALHALVRRHPVLRTTYAHHQGGPVQRVQPVTGSCREPFDVFERVCAQGWDDDQLRVGIRDAHHRPFDLERGPVLRAVLFERDEHEHVLLLVVHHIAADGWSLWILIEQLRHLYAAASQEVAVSMPPVGASYLGYAAARHEDAEGPGRAQHLAYWSRQLEGVPPVLELLGDHPRPSTHRNRGASHSFRVDLTLTEGIVALARERKVTPYAVLLAAWQILLSRTSGQRDFVVGCPTFGREDAGLAEVVGDFVNVAPIRARLTDDPTFADHVRRVREDLLEGIAHADCPLAAIVDRVGVPREVRRPPLVQALFVLQTPQRGRDLLMSALGDHTTWVEFGWLEASAIPVDQQEGHFDLILEVVDLGRDSGQGLHCVIKYNTDLFVAESARRLAEGFVVLLRDALRRPSARTSALMAHEPAELERLLAAVNDTRRPFPSEATVHDLVVAQCRRTPDAPALLWDDHQLTYRQLYERASALAARLRRRGVGPEVCVATCLERSPQLIVAFLAVLIAGGAYVPLDPSYPTRRLQFMMTDVRASLLLTDLEHADLLGAGPDAGFEVLCLDDDGDPPGGPLEDPLGDLPSSREGDASSLAYVLYTSGSTGRPKGVMVTHRAILRLCFDREFASLGHSDRVAQVCNASFDVATFEIWAPLLHGACIVGVPKAILLDPQRLARFITEQALTTMFVVPTVFNQTVRAVPRAFAPLSTLIVGGEALDPRWTRHALKHGPPRRLLNGYGPTECTGFATWHLVERVAEGVDGTLASVPIGRPIANTQAYVLDEHHRPRPIGVPGQLYLGGDGLARGYFDRPELDAERFIASPFEPGARLYATGDLARLRPDGTFEYLGRQDHQVKVRGVRIELGEIEAALAELPAIADVVVLAREDRPGDKRLVAYVVPEQGSAVPGLGELREQLQRSLPLSMIPTALVALDAMPTSVNGKLDRARLPPPGGSSEVTALTRPRTAVEQRLAAIWRAALTPDDSNAPIGRDQNFFEIGGDSIKVIRIHHELTVEFGIDVPVLEMFRRPTIAALAGLIEPEAKPESEPEAEASQGSSRPANATEVDPRAQSERARARIRMGQTRRHQRLRRRLQPARGE
ncbi:MAG: amino acid adenylation domain-containing protein [Myxococcota bacterium]